MTKIRSWLATTMIALAGSIGCRPAPPQPTPPEPTSRVVELEQSLGLVDATIYVTMAQGATQAQGAMTIESGAANQKTFAAAYGCRMQRLAGPEPRWVCQVPFRRGEPDWAGLLRHLEQLGPAPNDSLWRIQTDQTTWLCMDGAPWRLTIRDATGTLLLQTKQACGPTSPERARYEAGIEAILRAVQTQGGAG